MTVQLQEQAGSKVIEVRVSGKLSKEDYHRFVPDVERAIDQYGKIRLLLEMNDFHGWEFGALWEDIKFDLKHFRHIERLAMVGQTHWEQGMAAFCKPFTTAEVRFFTPDQIEQARQWLSAD